MKIDDAIKFFEEAAKASARLGTEKLELGAVAHIAYGSYSQIAEWLKELKQLKQRPTIDAVSEWIPCSERLPKIGECHISEPCIVYCKGGVYAFAELEENIFGQVGWNCERDDDYHEPIGEVVAWMPLPKPYREREGE